MTYHSGKIEIRATALEPIHHGAGVSGNTSKLRTQDIVLPDGRRARVPMVSGNSVKNRLRRAAVSFALDAMGVEDGSLNKAEVDLLFSGGHLSKGGKAVDLSRAREIERLFPALSMCGYSAGNTMPRSKLRVAHLHLVCEENAWRVPADLAQHPALRLRAGALRSDEFGTRHEMRPGSREHRLLPAAEQERRAKKKKSKQKGEDHPDKGDSAQMIYGFEAIAAGSTLWGEVGFTDLTDLEVAALSSAFHYASAGRGGRDGLLLHVGAKSSVGYGQIEVHLRGSLRAEAASYAPAEGIVVADQGDDRAARYLRHLREHRDEILTRVREAVS